MDTYPTSHVSDDAAESSLKEIIKFILKNTLLGQSKDNFPETCRLLKVILQNIQKNPEDEKFKSIKLSNPKFQKYIKVYPSAVSILEILGFQVVEETESLLFGNKEHDFKVIIDLLDRYSQKNKQVSKPLSIPSEPSIYPPFQSLNPSLSSQLAQYRAQQKTKKNKAKKIWTISDLQPAPLAPARMVQVYNTISSFKDPRNLVLRAFELVTTNQSNNFRLSQGKPPLTWSEGLSQIAYLHSKNMGEKKVPFGHSGFNQRFKQFPFPSVRSGGENVGYNFGHSDPSQICVDGWISSPGHRKNLLNTYTYMGIGLFVNESDYYYFTQLFALV